MKKSTATVLLLALLASFNLPGQAPDSSLQEEVAEFTSMELIETWGYLLAERFNLGGLEVTDAEIEVIVRGMKKFINSEDPPTDLSRSINPVQNYWLQREGIVREDQKKRNEEAEVEFFDTLVGRPEYQSLATGLFFQILDPGSNEKPSKNDRVRCHYVGMFLDGTEFDNSYKRDEPSDFSLASVIAGWTQGVPLIGVGGKVRLYVPARLAYGDTGRSGVPPASALIFEIELIEIIGPDTGNSTLPSIPQ